MSNCLYWHHNIISMFIFAPAFVPAEIHPCPMLTILNWVNGHSQQRHLANDTFRWTSTIYQSLFQLLLYSNLCIEWIGINELRMVDCYRSHYMLTNQVQSGQIEKDGGEWNVYLHRRDDAVNFEYRHGYLCMKALGIMMNLKSGSWSSTGPCCVW